MKTYKELLAEASTESFDKDELKLIKKTLGKKYKMVFTDPKDVWTINGYSNSYNFSLYKESAMFKTYYKHSLYRSDGVDEINIDRGSGKSKIFEGSSDLVELKKVLAKLKD